MIPSQSNKDIVVCNRLKVARFPEEDPSLPLQYHRRNGSKNFAKNKERKTQMLGVSGRKKKKKDPLHNLNKMVCHLDDWPATLFPNIL